MSNRLSPEKATAIAYEYISNGFIKSKALLTLGYKPSYANNNIGLKLFDNVLVKEAIAKIQAKSAVRSDITVQTIQQDLLDIRTDAIKNNDITARIRATELLGKTIAAFTENINSTDTTAQAALDATQKEQAQRIANILIKAG